MSHLMEVVSGNYLNIVTTVAGSGIQISLPNDDVNNPIPPLVPEPATSATFSSVTGIWGNTMGDLYISDSLGNNIRKLGVLDNIVHVVAGTGELNGRGDEEPATSAALGHPQQMFGYNDKLYFADNDNHVIRFVDLIAGTIHQYAGDGSSNSDNGVHALTSVGIPFPVGVWVDSDGYYMYVSQTATYSAIQQIDINLNIVMKIIDHSSMYNPQQLFMSGSTLYMNTMEEAENYGYIRSCVANDCLNTLSMLAGEGAAEGSTTDGSVFGSKIMDPVGISGSSDGTILYFAERSLNRVRTVSGGVLTRVLGDMGGFPSEDSTDSNGDGGPPLSATLSSPNHLFMDSVGQLFIADSLNFKVRKLYALVPSIRPTPQPTVTAKPTLYTSSLMYIDTVAGTGGAVPNVYEGLAGLIDFAAPDSIWGDSVGNLFISDPTNKLIRKVDTSGFMTNFAGTGAPGNNGDGGPATSARIPLIGQIHGDTNGLLYVTIFGSQKIRVIDRSDGIINAFAGIGGGEWLGGGNGGQATAAQFQSPYGIWADLSGNVYVGEQVGNRIRMIDNTGIVSLIADSITYNFLLGPKQLYGDNSGNLYIAVTDANRIAKYSVTSDVLTVFAGNGETEDTVVGDAFHVSIASPNGVWGDVNGRIYICNSHKIYSVTDEYLEIVAGGEESTVIGGANGDTGDPLSATFSNPNSLFVDTIGSVFVADMGNNRIRKMYEPLPTAQPTYSHQPTESPTLNPTYHMVPMTYISTIAGTGATNSTKLDTELAFNVPVHVPNGVWGDSTGVLYLSDTGGNKVKKITVDGLLVHIAGDRNGVPGYSGDGGAATSAQLNGPTQIISGPDSLLFVDADSNRVREISSTHTISTLIGGGAGLFLNGATATSGEFNKPYGIAVDTALNIYISAVSEHSIWRSNTDRIMSKLAGTGSVGNTGNNGPATSAIIRQPRQLFVDSAARLFVAEQNNHQVRVISLSNNIIINQFAGTGVENMTPSMIEEGPATSLTLKKPFGVWGNLNGIIFIAEQSGNTVRRVEDGYMTVIAGNGIECTDTFCGDGGRATSAQTKNPTQIFVDTVGQLYFTDTGGNKARKLSDTVDTREPTASPTVTPSANPTMIPTLMPTEAPSEVPTMIPTLMPTEAPSEVPTLEPSDVPTVLPTEFPTITTSLAPSAAPTTVPTAAPTTVPSLVPSEVPTDVPSETPTVVPSEMPTVVPSEVPTVIPSEVPTVVPSELPTVVPSEVPTVVPSEVPTVVPSELPTVVPSEVPTVVPSEVPTVIPSEVPTVIPSEMPRVVPSEVPTVVPSELPTVVPSETPTVIPSEVPTVVPSVVPTVIPSEVPTVVPSEVPTVIPSEVPTVVPSEVPTVVPTVVPREGPSFAPTVVSTVVPSLVPTVEPSDALTVVPTILPTVLPTAVPTNVPTTEPSVVPSVTPTREPTNVPTLEPSGNPTVSPSELPTELPNEVPLMDPSIPPTDSPTVVPAAAPTATLSEAPTETPTMTTTMKPSVSPTDTTTLNPTVFSTVFSTVVTSVAPSATPTATPSAAPTAASLVPSAFYVVTTVLPTQTAIVLPTAQPSAVASNLPTIIPSAVPSLVSPLSPTELPSEIPSTVPSCTPSDIPSTAYTVIPSTIPLITPSGVPSAVPPNAPALGPSISPMGAPSKKPTGTPTIIPSAKPSATLSEVPTMLPTVLPTVISSVPPTVVPSIIVTPTQEPSAFPSTIPNSAPTTVPSNAPHLSPRGESSVPTSSLRPTSSYETTLAPTANPTFRSSAASLPSDHASISVHYNDSVKPQCKIVLPFLFTSAVSGNGFQDIHVMRPIEGSNFVYLGGKRSDSVERIAAVSLPVQSPAVSYDFSGRSVSIVGDINGDGYDDLIIGVPFASRVYVLFGTETGFMNMTEGFTIFGSRSYDMTGWSVSGAGDVNNDSVPDLIVGAPSARNAVEKQSGVTYVLHGTSGNYTNIYLDSLVPEQGFAIDGTASQDNLGLSVSGAGDVNEDGVDDIIVGALRTGSLFSGAAYVIYGTNKSTRENIIFSSPLTQTTGFSVFGTAYTWLGYSVSGAGDVDGDGIVDIVIGSVSRRDVAETPVSYVLYGNATTRSGLTMGALLLEAKSVSVIGAGVVVMPLQNITGDGHAGVMLGADYSWSTGGGFVATVPENMEGITAAPVVVPTRMPTVSPSKTPSARPSRAPSFHPTMTPTQPTRMPTMAPSGPTYKPTMTPTQPTSMPSSQPTAPTMAPSTAPSLPPTEGTSANPSTNPTAMPSYKPSSIPTFIATNKPNTGEPTHIPTLNPSISPTKYPINRPTIAPTVFILPNITYETVSISSGGVYDRDNSNKHYIVNTTQKVIITGGSGRVLVTVLPQKLAEIEVQQFNVTKDVLDLRSFPQFHSHIDLNFSFTTILPARRRRSLQEINNAHNLYVLSIELGSGQMVVLKGLENDNIETVSIWFASPEPVINEQRARRLRTIIIATVVGSLVCAFVAYHIVQIYSEFRTGKVKKDAIILEDIKKYNRTFITFTGSTGLSGSSSGISSLESNSTSEEVKSDNSGSSESHSQPSWKQSVAIPGGGGHSQPVSLQRQDTFKSIDHDDDDGSSDDSDCEQSGSDGSLFDSLVLSDASDASDTSSEARVGDSMSSPLTATSPTTNCSPFRSVYNSHKATQNSNKESSVCAPVTHTTTPGAVTMVENWAVPHDIEANIHGATMSQNNHSSSDSAYDSISSFELSSVEDDDEDEDESDVGSVSSSLSNFTVPSGGSFSV